MMGDPPPRAVKVLGDVRAINAQFLRQVDQRQVALGQFATSTGQ